MFTLDVKADVTPTIRYLNRIKEGLGDQAIASALNKTIAQTRTQMISGITSTYNIKAGLVRERLQLKRASRAGMKFTATLTGNPYGRAKRSMNIIHFIDVKTTTRVWKKRGQHGGPQLMAKVLKGGGPKLVGLGAFVANSGRTVFIRTGPGHNAPIRPVQTIGVPQMFMAKKVQVPVQKWIAANFPRIFDHEAQYFLSRVKP